MDSMQDIEFMKSIPAGSRSSDSAGYLRILIKEGMPLQFAEQAVERRLLDTWAGSELAAIISEDVVYDFRAKQEAIV